MRSPAKGAAVISPASAASVAEKSSAPASWPAEWVMAQDIVSAMLPDRSALTAQEAARVSGSLLAAAVACEQIGQGDAHRGRQSQRAQGVRAGLSSEQFDHEFDQGFAEAKRRHAELSTQDQSEQCASLAEMMVRGMAGQGAAATAAVP